jgi:hypothetical protein
LWLPSVDANRGCFLPSLKQGNHKGFPLRRLPPSGKGTFSPLLIHGEILHAQGMTVVDMDSQHD